MLLLSNRSRRFGGEKVISKNINEEVNQAAARISHNIQYLRMQQRLSVPELAKFVNIEEKILILVENREAVAIVCFDHLKRLSQYFNVSIEKMMEQDLSHGYHSKI